MERKEARVLIWHFIRSKESFETSEVVQSVRCGQSTLSVYLRELIPKYVEVVFCSENIRVLRVLNRRLMVPPLLSEDKGDKVWRSIRILKSFDSAELAAVCDLSQNWVQKYLLKLSRTGLIKVAKPSQGVNGRCALYRLISDLGVGAPLFFKDGRVLDCNSGKYVEVKE